MADGGVTLLQLCICICPKSGSIQNQEKVSPQSALRHDLAATIWEQELIWWRSDDWLLVYKSGASKKRQSLNLSRIDWVFKTKKLSPKTCTLRHLQQKCGKILNGMASICYSHFIICFQICKYVVCFKKSYSNNLDVVIISLTFSGRCASDARCFGFKTTISPPGTTSDLPGYVLTLWLGGVGLMMVSWLLWITVDYCRLL